MSDTELTVSHSLVVGINPRGLDFNGLVQAVVAERDHEAGAACQTDMRRHRLHSLLFGGDAPPAFASGRMADPTRRRRRACAQRIRSPMYPHP